MISSIHSELVSIINSLPTKNTRKIIFICGLGGAGKTEFSNSLHKQLGESSVIFRHDWYLKYPTLVRKERMRQAVASKDSQRINAEENPVNWMDDDAFVKDLKEFRDTGALSLTNVWNQQTGDRDLSLEITSEPHGIIIVEGIYLLHEPVARLADLTIRLEISPEIARQRANQRDKYRSDVEYLAYKQQLVQKYDLPYFAKYTHNIDITIDNNNYQKPEIMH